MGEAVQLFYYDVVALLEKSFPVLTCSIHTIVSYLAEFEEGKNVRVPQLPHQSNFFDCLAIATIELHVSLRFRVQDPIHLWVGSISEFMDSMN